MVAAKVKMGRPPMYPWRTMKVGGEFVLTGSMSRQSAWSQCVRAHRRTGRTFTITGRTASGYYIVRRTS